MKKFLLGLLTFFVFTASAQEDEITTLRYCGQTFQVPENCTANSESELACQGYVIQWLYMNNQMLKTMPQQFITQLEDKLRRAKKEPIACVSLGETIDGYKISYKNKRHINYKIVAYGPVNGQPVLIILTLQDDPINNDALPDFVRQIIELEAS